MIATATATIAVTINRPTPQISEQTYYRWRNQFGGLKADDAKRLKDLERENATLKRLLADAELEKAALKEIARETSEPGTPAGGRGSPHPRDGRQRAVRLPGDRPEPNNATTRTGHHHGRRSGRGFASVVASLGEGSSAARVPQRLSRRLIRRRRPKIDRRASRLSHRTKLLVDVQIDQDHTSSEELRCLPMLP
jgi:hypothetical protein